MIPLENVLLLSGILFSLSVAGIFINRKNVLLLLMCIELMAHQVLAVTVSRLRKLLGRDAAVGYQGGKLWLDGEYCWVDLWRFQALVSASGPASRRQALDAYAGAFLPDDECEPWSVPMREKLRGKFIHALAAVGQELEAQGRLEEAIQLYLRGIDADVVAEASHRGRMRGYRSAGRRTEAVSAYRRLRQTSSVVLGVAPSEESQALYREVIRDLARCEAQAAPDVAPRTWLTKLRG